MKKKQPLKEKTREDAGTGRCTKPGCADHSCTHKNQRGGIDKGSYQDIIRALFEKYNKRIATYYCSNLSCRNTFWSADDGYVCPQCGAFGMISEIRSQQVLPGSHPQHVLGCLDNIGRLICRECMERYEIDDTASFIVYTDTRPYCREACEVCRRLLSHH